MSVLHAPFNHPISWSVVQVSELAIAAEEHAGVIEENKRLYNEVLDLKGNIRVFCRLRPAGATGDASQREDSSSTMQSHPCLCLALNCCATESLASQRLSV